ncbi:MAG: prolipoprotein diacylglyceryl transferase [Candidatus Doudnabacteria bacterium]|nr:prolipoprotein diacylglyceryl transferase [Candidatus Doudnabacteria bacterium]
MKKYLLASIILLIGLFFFLKNVFSGGLILPQTFRLGPVVIHYYGIIMAAAAAAGFVLATSRVRKFDLEPKAAEDMLFWVIVGGFVGARLYHVLSSFGYYLQYPLDAFKVWNGGLSIYGAVLGGILTLWVLKRLFTNHYSLFTILDWLAPSVILGQIIGRFGNLFNYEAFGYPTNLPWKMFVPEIFRPVQFIRSAYFHPWFLYELLGNVLILTFLLKMGKPKRPGQVVLFYILLYNSLRFCLEFLRIDSTFIGAFRLNAISSLVLVLAAAVGLFYANKRTKPS